MNENNKKLVTVNAQDLLQQEFEPLQFAIDKILPHGLFILAGSGKIGKSWLSLDMCIAVATGGKVWEFDTSQGEVLYLALEDNYQRLQSRLNKIGADVKNSAIDGLYLATASFGLSSGLVEQVNEFLANHPNTKLIVIDTLERIRDTELDKSIYACDYRDMTALREIMNNHKLTLLLVHHTRKMQDDDPLNMLSGSTGLVGSGDGVFVLQKELRTSNKAILTIANRDTEGFCFNLELDNENCKWIFKGKHNNEEPSQDDLQNAKNEKLCLLVDEFLKEEKWVGTATELANALKNDTSHLTIKRQLFEISDLLAKCSISLDEERNSTLRKIILIRNCHSENA